MSNSLNMVRVYRNVRNGKVVVGPDKRPSNIQRSAQRFKGRMYEALKANIRFKTFITFTYDQKHVGNACSTDMADLTKKLRAWCAEKGLNLTYGWRADWGDQNGRIHFHMMTNLRFIPRAELQGLWDRGNIDIQVVKNAQHAGWYISRYMSDVSEKSAQASSYTGKLYSCSNDVPPAPRSDWSYLGTMPQVIADLQ